MRVLPILLLAPLLGGCHLFRARPPKYEWVSLGQHLRLRDMVVPVEGPEVHTGDEVELHYDLSLEGGTPVESSRDRGVPIRVRVGDGSLPAGLERGLVGMRLFGRREIVVPPSLGYGRAGRPPFIPPDATLVFVVEVLALDSAAPAETPAGAGAPQP